MQSGQAYFIINKKSGTAFDLSGQDQRSIIGFNLHRGENQKWRFVQQDGGWTIQNLYNGKYLDVDIPNTFTDGVRVIAIDTNNPRRWDVRRDQQDVNGWRIVIPGTNQNVDLSDNGNPNPGTPVTLWDQWNGENQVWRLEQA
ncbi:carbohydrate-binding module family 13 protein [Thelephora ganbajun]|uniref:Carbohydrate-binding module family 13 protein n=1 Tax=Thelephora ganbajun TaxID=370292 RepID=A0ACB6ZBJ2_THEGA|nr:carbohydrate-binding module family 13 protein [Thelephora ganbajun]